MTLVLDASLTVSWFFADEQTADRLAVLDRVVADGATVPPLWRFEVANALLVGVRRGRIDAAFMGDAAKRLEALSIKVDSETARLLWTRTVALAHHHRLTIYDAVYLELVMRLGLTLASLDAALCAACVAEGGTVVRLGPALPT